MSNVNVVPRSRRSIRLFLPALLGLATVAVVAAAVDHDTRLLRGLEVVEADHLALCPATRGQENLANAVDKLANQARAELASGASGTAALQTLNHLVFGSLGIRGSPDLKNPCNLLPSRVLERKQGYCVGIAALCLLLGVCPSNGTNKEISVMRHA